MNKSFSLIFIFCLTQGLFALESTKKKQKETKLFDLENRVYDPETGPKDRVALENQFIRQGQLYMKNPANYFNDVLFNKLVFQDATRTLYQYKNDYYYRFQISNYFFGQAEQFKDLDAWTLENMPHSYLHARLNRKNKFLKKLWGTFGDNLLSLLVPHFKVGSNNYRYVDALIRTYDGIIAQDEYEKKIAAILLRLDADEPSPASMIDYMQPILVKEIETEFERTTGSDYYKWQDVQWFHSFWVRRFKEGNKEMVLEVLKQIRARGE